MRILIDGFWWSDGPISNRQVLREQVLTWQTMFPNDDLHMVVPRDSVAEVRRELSPSIGIHPSLFQQHGLQVMFGLNRLVSELEPDALLTQNFTPVKHNAKTGVFVHDLIFETSPRWFTHLERIYFGQISRGLKRADVVLTSSMTERLRIERLHNKIARVKNVGLAIGSELASARSRKPSIDISEFAFWLVVGRLNVRKNLRYTIEVLVQSRRINAACPLVVVGPLEGRTEDLECIHRWVERKFVVFTGQVTTDELSWLYENCRVFAFGSLDEGFGLPPVEAQFFGAPVLVSDIPVMREVTQGQASYFPLDDVGSAASIAAGISERTEASMLPDIQHVQSRWRESVRQMRYEFERLATSGGHACPA